MGRGWLKLEPPFSRTSLFNACIIAIHSSIERGWPRHLRPPTIRSDYRQPEAIPKNAVPSSRPGWRRFDRNSESSGRAADHRDDRGCRPTIPRLCVTHCSFGMTRKTRKTGYAKLQALLLCDRFDAVVSRSYQPTSDLLSDIFGDGGAWGTFYLNGIDSAVSFYRKMDDDIRSRRLPSQHPCIEVDFRQIAI